MPPHGGSGLPASPVFFEVNPFPVNYNSVRRINMPAAVAAVRMVEKGAQLHLDSFFQFFQNFIRHDRQIIHIKGHAKIG